jgi:hypothetical protein
MIRFTTVPHSHNKFPVLLGGNFKYKYLAAYQGNMILVPLLLCCSVTMTLAIGAEAERPKQTQ